LPSLLEYVSIHNKIPTNLTFSFACLIRFYQGTWQGKKLPIKDSDEIICAFGKIWGRHDYLQIAQATLENKTFWDQDLTKINKLPQAIAMALEEIETHGIEKGFANFSKKY